MRFWRSPDEERDEKVSETPTGSSFHVCSSLKRGILKDTVEFPTYTLSLKVDTVERLLTPSVPRKPLPSEAKTDGVSIC